VSEDGSAKLPDEAAERDSEPVTWYDIVEPQKVPRSLRRLPGLCREAVRLVWAAGRRELVAAMAIKAVNGAGLAVVLLLGRDVIAAVAAAGRSGAGAGPVLPRLLLLTAVTAGLGFLAAIGREISEILAELASRHAQAEIIEAKEKTMDVDREEITAKVEKLQAEVAKLKGRLSDAEKAAGTSAEMEEWRRDLDARVKIVQKKAFDLLDREEKLREKEEQLKALAERLGVRA